MRSNDSAAQRAYRLVFWDWNGTLLDDTAYAMSVRNRVFPSFGLSTIDSLRDYHEQFTFPIRAYYERAGVTEEMFVPIANAWMAEYVRGMADIPLQPDALDALALLAENGLSQIVLSASDLGILRAQLHLYPIEGYFADVLGLGHIFGDSKTSIGVSYMRENAIKPESCVMLGDTLHDAEVAQGMGCDCVLIARGHQSAESLRTAGVPVFDHLRQAVEHVIAFSED